MISNQLHQGYPCPARPWLGLPLVVFAPLALSSAQSTEVPTEASLRTPATELVLTLDKFDETHADALTSALEAIAQPTYECPVCSFTALSAGECPECEEDLELQETPMHPVRSAEADVESHSVRLLLNPSRTVNLTAIERAIKQTGIKLRRNDLPVLAWTRMTFSTDDEEPDLDELRAALLDLSIEITRLELNEDETVATVTFGKTAGAVTLGQITKALKTADSSFAFTDLVWCGPCTGCASKGATLATCNRCWTAPNHGASHGG